MRKLLPGETSISNDKPSKTSTGAWRLVFSVCLPDGRTVRKSVQGPTKAGVRRLAYAKAHTLTSITRGGWSLQSSFKTYAQEVVEPLLSADTIAPSTSKRYKASLDRILGKCPDKACTHKYSLAHLTIDRAMRPRALKNCIEEIAQLHGYTWSKNCKTVLSAYVAQQLKLDELILVNPLRDLPLDLSRAKKPTIQRGGKSLTPDQYHKAINWLLDTDRLTVEAPKRGHWTLENIQATRKAAIDFVLIQAASGLRTNEVARRTKADITFTKQSRAVFHVPAEDNHNRKPKVLPILDDRVSKLVKLRWEKLKSPSDYLFSSPAAGDPTVIWNPRNRDRKLAEVYKEMAAALDLAIFEVERGHSWRAIVNTLTKPYVSEDIRLIQLGHTAEVSRTAYTGIVDPDAIADTFIKALKKE